jgi:peptide/nickel transport system permease protein
VQQQRNPFFAPIDKPGPLLPAYFSYLQKAVTGDFGSLPIGTGLPIIEAVGSAVVASLGLLLIAFVLSLIIGSLLGFAAVRHDPPSVAPWLAPFSTFGLAMPSFFVGTIFIVGAVNVIIRAGREAMPFPTAGFGWDLHLVFPVLALMLRPTVQIAQITAKVLSPELSKQYVTTARGVGNPWRVVRWKHALRNALAPIILTMAASFRLLMGELIVVEWLFSWPGIGRLLAWILIPSQSTTQGESLYFLYPPALAATLTAFAVFFLLADIIASTLVRSFDPRYRSAESNS